MKVFQLILFTNLCLFSCFVYGQEEKRVHLDERFSVTLPEELFLYKPYTEASAFYPDSTYYLFSTQEPYTFGPNLIEYTRSTTEFRFRNQESSVFVYKSYDLSNYKLMRKIDDVGISKQDSLIINFLKKRAEENYSDAFIHGGGVSRYKQNKPKQLFDKYWYIDAWIKRRHPEASREFVTRYMRYIFVDSNVYSISVASKWCYQRESCRCRANAKQAFYRLINSIRIKEEEE